jgi:hypothetical protein
MFGAQVHERCARGRCRRRMRRRSPIDEERNEAVAEHRPRIGHCPSQRDAVRPATSALRHGIEIDAACLRLGRKTFEAAAVRGPPDESRRAEVVDPEPARRGRPRLLRIGRDDLEVTRRSKRDERVARAPAGMLSAGRRAHAEQPLHALDTGREIGRRVDQVVDLVERIHDGIGDIVFETA